MKIIVIVILLFISQTVVSQENILKPVFSGRYWGFCNELGKFRLPAIYEDCNRQIYLDVIAVSRNGKWALIDTSGRILTNWEFSSINNFSNSLAKVCKNNRYGFINKNGLEVIPVIYEDATDFSVNKARVCREGKWAIINNTGTEITPNIYDKIFEYKNELCLAKKNGKWGYIDKDGKETTEFIYDFAQLPNENKLLQIKKDGKYGLVDNFGKEIIKPEFDSIGDKSYNGFVIVKNKGKIGIVDYLANRKIECLYDDCSLEFDSVIWLKKNGKWAFSYIKSLNFTDYEFDEPVEFSGNKAVVGKNNRFGIISIMGELITPIKYDKLFFFVKCENKEIYAVVTQKGKDGLINTKGEEIIPCIYDAVLPFFLPDYFKVTNDGKDGIFKISEGLIVECKFDKIIQIQTNMPEFMENMGIPKFPPLWLIQKNNRFTVWDTSFVQPFVLECNEIKYADKYQTGFYYNDYYLILNKNNRYGAYNVAKKEITIPIEYEDVSIGLHGIWVKQNGHWHNYFSAEENYSAIFPAKWGNTFASITLKDKKKGITLPNGVQYIPPIFDTISYATPYFAWVKTNGKWHEFNYLSKTIIPLDADSTRTIAMEKGTINIAYKNNLIKLISSSGKISNYFYDNIIMEDNALWWFLPVCKNNEWGILNLKSMQEVVIPKYSEIKSFTSAGSGGTYLASVTENEEIYQIDTLGRKFFEEVIITKKRGKYGITAWLEDKQIYLVQPIYQKLKYSDFDYNIFVAKKNNKFGMINSFGDSLLSFQYQKISFLLSATEEYYVLLKKENKKGIYSHTNFNEIIPCKYHRIFPEYIENNDSIFFKVSNALNVGLYRNNGNIILDCFFNDFSIHYYENNHYIYAKQKRKYSIYSFNTGKKLTTEEFDEIAPIVDGFARVRQGNKWGFVNIEGKLIVPCKYKYLNDFMYGKAFFRNGKIYGEVDTDGNEYVDDKP